MSEVERLKAIQGDGRRVEHIVELEPGVWLAPWQGDPGRTCVIHSARLFQSEMAARMAMARAKATWGRTFLEARVIAVRCSIELI